jgi:hypothetical protein
MNAEEHGPRRRSRETAGEVAQKHKYQTCRCEEEKKYDPVVAVRVEAEPMKENRRYRLTRQRPIPIRYIEGIQSVEEFTPATKAMRHIEQCVALKELGEAVGEGQILEEAEE